MQDQGGADWHPRQGRGTGGVRGGVEEEQVSIPVGCGIWRGESECGRGAGWNPCRMWKQEEEEGVLEREEQAGTPVGCGHYRSERGCSRGTDWHSCGCGLWRDERGCGPRWSRAPA
eukprot:1158376-Pelagomonas_calceolata.AAC.9